MWFGDNVTVRQWNDIFNNEAYASWAQWGCRRAHRRTERQRGDERAPTRRRKDEPEFWQVTMIDPSREHLFDAVYLRGPMALQGLRNVIGDDAFFKLARDWAQSPGSRTSRSGW